MDRDDAVIQGKGVELAHVDSSAINVHAHATDTKSALKETGPKFQQVDHITMDSTEAGVTAVINNKTGGDHVMLISLEDQNFKAGSLSSTRIYLGLVT